MEADAQQFEVIPAVDVLEGRAARLHQGERHKVTIDAGDPAALAERFAHEGARRLHLIDLDGAFGGRPSPGLLDRISRAARHVPLQVGGGYRTDDAISVALEAGADRVL